MLAASKSENVEKPLGTLHPEKIAKMAEMMAQQLRSRTKDIVRIGHPTAGGKQFIAGNCLRVNEYVQDLKILVEWYLK